MRPSDIMHTPDRAFVEEVLAHARKQLEKGWAPLSTANNLRARFGLTLDCGKQVVGLIMANRVGPSVEHLAVEMATALQLSKEEATARVLEVKNGPVDPDDWSTVPLEFDPERAPSFVPPQEEPAPSPEARSGPTADQSARLRGPIHLEFNLRSGSDASSRKKGGLFRR